MTRIQEGWLTIALAIVCLVQCIGNVRSIEQTSPGQPIDIGEDLAEIPGVKPLDSDVAATKTTEKSIPDKTSKIEVPDVKPANEAKKKTITDFSKPKPEPKYQKSKDTKVIDEPVTTTLPSDSTNKIGATEEPATTTTITDKPLEKKVITDVPLLLRGEPIVQATTNTEEPSTNKANVGTTGSPTTTENTRKEEETATSTTLAQPEVIASRARALNVSASEPTNTLHSNNTDLSDVSMDEEDKEVEGGEYIAMHNSTAANATMVSPLPTASTTTTSMCIEGNNTYAVGQLIRRGCQEQCLCGDGGKLINCEPVCRSPLVIAGSKITDPFCQARNIPENPCCAFIVCSDSAPEPEESCVLGNSTVARGQKVQDGCSKTCVCEAGGHLKCQPRCPPNDTTSGVNQHDRCVVLQDPSDSCCTITLCDVTLGDHEIKPESPADLSVNLTDVKVLNSTAIKLKLSSKSPDEVTIELSENNHVWRQVKPTKDGIISDLQPAHGYYVRVIDGSRAGPAIHVSMLAEVIKTSVTEKSEKGTCNYRGKTYKIGAEWHDECIAICFCNETAHTECVTIECPTDFGLDVLDPQCLDWETVPPNHVPKAPHCCPQEVRCRNNGSCTYEGKLYDNWTTIPTNITGCEKECFCEFGNVTCHAACAPVPQLPPSSLNCKPHEAILAHLPGDDCCLHWTCPSSETTLPGKNATTYVYPGPVVIDTTAKQPKDKPDFSKTKQEVPQGASYPWPVSGATHPPQPAMPPNSDILHYPMDPGHPTVPYMGPYNPDFKPTQPSVEELFHLPGHVEKAPPIKEKSKSKSDSKKPVDVFKQHKDGNIEQFPGPLAPDRFPEKMHPPEKPILPSLSKPINPNIVAPQSPNKLPGLNKGGASSDPTEQTQFIPLNVHDHMSVPPFGFTPNNGENISPGHFDTLLENSAASPAYNGPIGSRPESADPNNVVPVVSKKKVPGSDIYPGEKGKPSLALPPKRPDVPLRNSNPETIPDELYHLINLQHPGLIQLDHGPPTGHPGLYDIHQEIAGGEKTPPQQPAPVAPNYFGPTGVPPKKGGALGKPQIFTQKDENGQTTYHVHASEVPNSPQQLEELLAHIAQHDPSNNPYQQHYPVGQQQANVPLQGPPPPPLPPHGVGGIDPHGFVAQTPPGPGQSGFEHIPPIGQFPGIAGIPGHGSANVPTQQAYEISVEDLRAISGNTVRLMFTVPSVLVGLHGRVEVRYTSDKANIDPSTWKSQTFAPPGDLIDTEDLEFDLSGLKPSTVYRLMIVVKLRDLSNTHTSKIYQVRTLDKQATSSTPTDITIDTELKVLQVNSTFAEFEWKKFSNYEIQFIDGIYLMYKAEDEKIYSVTPLLHRSVNHYVLDHLRPLTTYEVHLSTKDIVGQANVLIDSEKVSFTTTAESDPYSFDVKVEIKTIKSTDVEVSWSGVPQPQDKYVNIYRAVYQSDSGKEDTSTFKIAKKDSPAKTIISDLKPGTRYRLWIEVYLTNGKIKKSNVQDFVTKPGVLLPPGASQQQGKLASIPLHEGDYYGPLVIVAIVASLAILSTLILLMMLMKRRTSSKADISPRKTTSAYDNPSYKTCEETVPNGRNKTYNDHELATMNGNGNSSNNANNKEVV